MMIVNEKRSHQPKPPKLRSACNPCNAAKVKCSGELTGCTRCQDFGTKCIYVESRVGKVQGVRARRRRSEQKPVSSADVPCPRTVDNSIRVERSNEAHTESPQASPQRSNATPNSLDRALHGWSPEPWHSEIWDDSGLDLSGVNRNFPTTSSDFAESVNAVDAMVLSADNSTASFNLASYLDNTHFDGSVTDTGVGGPNSSIAENAQETARSPPTERTLDSFSNPATNTTSQQHPASVSAETNRGTRTLESICVLQCTKIVMALENYLLHELKVFDLILGTVRSATDEVTKIIQHQEGSRSDRCIFLLLTIMSQLVALLEIGSRVTQEEEPQNQAGFAGKPLGSASNFGFSAFDLDPEEQKDWQIRKIRRECQHIRQMLGKITVLAISGAEGIDQTTSLQREERSACFRGIEYRLKALCEATGEYSM
ncbi:unnamed protein product [Periconia digitata]|uniref:Zn(2)-C6 fungal-type domain-containing protein n=1 Tax=Periconia digitata TaxID=1303443 RepID=A0A9W4UHB2_9PLEO|nr:unnamed protein product [Periconia digitata]